METKMFKLICLFPSLSQKIKDFRVGDFDPIELWENAARWSHGEKCAAAFVLSVYNPRGEWTLPEGHEDRQAGAPAPLPFDFHEAFGVWDDAHRKGFLEWAKDPWWA